MKGIQADNAGPWRSESTHVSEDRLSEVAYVLQPRLILYTPPPNSWEEKKKEEETEK